jgi:hypothetical protein
MNSKYDPSKRTYTLQAEFPILNEGMKLFAQDVNAEDLEQTYNFLISTARRLKESQEQIRKKDSLERKAED